MTDKQIQELIELAEDHAYFAGQEKMREEMIEKACNKLESLNLDWYQTREGVFLTKKLVEDFRKVMMEE